MCLTKTTMSRKVNVFEWTNAGMLVFERFLGLCLMCSYFFLSPMLLCKGPKPKKKKANGSKKSFAKELTSTSQRSIKKFRHG